MRRKKGKKTQLPILEILWNNPNTDVSFLKKRTGFSDRQIWNALQQLRNRKLIKTKQIKRKAGYKILPTEKIEVKLLKENTFQRDRLRGLLGIRESDKKPIEELPKKEIGGVEKRHIFVPSKLE